MQDMEPSRNVGMVLDLADGNEAPFVLHRDLGGLEKILRDHVTSETAAIIIGDADLSAGTKLYGNAYGRKEAASNFEGEDVFERHDIHGVINRLVKPGTCHRVLGW